MKLVDLFEDNSPFKIRLDEPHGYFKREHLEPIKEFLQHFEEFSECGLNFDFVDYPCFTVAQDGKETAAKVQTYKIGPDFKIPIGAKVYALGKSPAMYDEKELRKGPRITPVLFDQEGNNFTPYKQIILQFSPELAQDLDLQAGEGSARKMLHEMLDQILDNPDKFAPKPIYAAFIRMWVPKP